MCATGDPKLLEESFEYLHTKARDQDVMHFMSGLRENIKARKRLAQCFKEKYEIVRFKFYGPRVCLSKAAFRTSFINVSKVAWCLEYSSRSVLLFF